MRLSPIQIKEQTKFAGPSDYVNIRNPAFEKLYSTLFYFPLRMMHDGLNTVRNVNSNFYLKL